MWFMCVGIELELVTNFLDSIYLIRLIVLRTSGIRVYKNKILKKTFFVRNMFSLLLQHCKFFG